MLMLLIGIFAGSIATLFTMSLMMAAKKGDEHLEQYEMIEE